MKTEDTIYKTEFKMWMKALKYQTIKNRLRDSKIKSLYESHTLIFIYKQRSREVKYYKLL